MFDSRKGEETIRTEHEEYYKWLTETALHISKAPELEKVNEAVVKGFKRFPGGISGVVFYISNFSDGLLYPVFQIGVGPEQAVGPVRAGEGLAGIVANERKAVFVNSDSSKQTELSSLIRDTEFSTFAGIPVVNKSSLTGVINLFCREKREFSAFEKDILKQASEICANIIGMASEYYKASDRAKRLIAVSRAITVTRQLGTLKSVMRDLAKLLVQSMGFDKSWIGIVDENTNTLEEIGSFGVKRQAIKCFSAPVSTKSSNPAIETLILEKPVVYQMIEDVDDKSCRSWLEKEQVQGLTFVPVFDDDKPAGVIGVFNTTQKMLTEEDIKTLLSVSEQAAIAIENARLYEKIKQSEENYKTLFQTSGSGLVIIDSEQRFVLVNRAFEDISGYSQKELTDEYTLTSFLSGKDISRKEITEYLTYPPQDFEADFKSKSGIVKQVHVTSTKLPNEENVLVSIVNVTKQRELEKKLFKSEELAAIGELSAGIAHEIRNPLIAIKTSVKLLMDEPQISDEGKQLLDVLREESDHLGAIVDDFLKFARPKKPDIVPVDLNQLIKDTVKRLRELSDKDLRWDESYDSSLSDVPCDRHQIQQLITNLINNGIDAIEEPGGTIKIKTELRNKRGSKNLHIFIKDSGDGIPEDELNKIFQPFFSTKETGTGMGLAICQRIVEAHKGEIEVTSKKGRGTEFTITLPLN